MAIYGHIFNIRIWFFPIKFQQSFNIIRLRVFSVWFFLSYGHIRAIFGSIRRVTVTSVAFSMNLL